MLKRPGMRQTWLWAGALALLVGGARQARAEHAGVVPPVGSTLTQASPSAPRTTRAASVPEEIHVLGHVNVNEATRAELERVPGLTRADVARILKTREQGPLTGVGTLGVSKQAARYLRTAGPTDLVRLRKLPLERAAVDPPTVPETTQAAR